MTVKATALTNEKEELKSIFDILIYFLFIFFWFKEFPSFLHELEHPLHFIAELIIRLTEEIY